MIVQDFFIYFLLVKDNRKKLGKISFSSEDNSQNRFQVVHKTMLFYKVSAHSNDPPALSLLG
jgi:hypothetical protein